MTKDRFPASATRLDDAARAGWLSYVAGNTQDEIAKKLGVSRQSAQRLVAMAVSERLVKVRIDHPIGHCMDLAQQLRERFGLQICEVVPTDPGAPELLTGAAIAAAVELEKILKQPEEKIIGLGTGRALKACVQQLTRIDCPQHTLVSRLGNMMSDGSATPYNATVRMADRVGAKHYPFALPVLAQTAEELAYVRQLEAVRTTMELCARADFTLVGIGQMDRSAPLHVDGFISSDEMDELERLGAVGEITSWVYDTNGDILDCGFNSRVASAPLTQAGANPMIAVAVGTVKVPAILAALRGSLINGLITSEETAAALLT